MKRRLHTYWVRPLHNVFVPVTDKEQSESKIESFRPFQALCSGLIWRRRRVLIRKLWSNNLFLLKIASNFWTKTTCAHYMEALYRGFWTTWEH